MTQRVDLNQMRHGTELLKRGFAKMQEGGVIMDVVTAEEAHIAEDSGATSVTVSYTHLTLPTILRV